MPALSVEEMRALGPRPKLPKFCRGRGNSWSPYAPGKRHRLRDKEGYPTENLILFRDKLGFINCKGCRQCRNEGARLRRRFRADAAA